MGVAVIHPAPVRTVPQHTTAAAGSVMAIPGDVVRDRVQSFPYDGVQGISPTL